MVLRQMLPWCAWLRLVLSLACWACLSCGAVAVPTSQPPRVALVVGNDGYANAPLANARQDAREIAAALRRLKFDVIEVTDGTRQQMDAAIQRLRAALAGKGGIGLFYYAGHAVQIEWRNFLVPVDAALRTARDVPAQTVDVNQILEAFAAAGTRTNIVVLDACRDNPFGSTGRAVGLSQIDAPPRTFIAYSTAPGNVAEDGLEGGHSLYTHYLLQELARPKSRVEDVFKRVRLQVRQRTEGRQIPWESTSLEDELHFDGDIAAMTPILEDEVRMREIESNFTQELADWKPIATGGSPERLYAFLQKYPNGPFAELVQFRLDQLQRPGLRAQPGQTVPETLPHGVNRFEKGDVIVYERIDDLAGDRRPVTLRVTQADRDRVEVNNGASTFDQMGGVLKNRFGEKVPAALVSPAEIAVGKRWRSAFVNAVPNGEVSSNYWDNHVVALETIDVPAGRYVAYRIERSGWARFSGAKSTRMSGTTWIDPRTMLAVRIDLMFRRDGKVIEKSSDRLLRLEQVPRSGGR